MPTNADATAPAVRAARARRADAVLRTGAVITAIGLVCLVVAIVPLVAPTVHLPGIMWFAAMLLAVGLVVVFVGLAFAARGRRGSGR